MGREALLDSTNEYLSHSSRMPTTSLGAILLAKGDVFRERYQIVQPLGMGAMGAVYEVFDQITHAQRALKVMLPSLLNNANLRARFAAEARATGCIESDHVVRIFDAGVDPATQMSFLVMELLRGQSLEEIITTRGALPRPLIIQLMFQMAWALDKTHNAGIVHRDLKPANVFLTTRDDGSPCLKILDFGIAKFLSSKAHTQSGALGTPLFMAPEQFRSPNQIGPQTDLYALGHIVFMTLTGHHYWSEEIGQCDTVYRLVDQILSGITEPPTTRAARKYAVELPAAFDAWMIRATATYPCERFPSAIQAVEALADALGESCANHDRFRESLLPQQQKRNEVTIADALASPQAVLPETEVSNSPKRDAHLTKSNSSFHTRSTFASRVRPRLEKFHGLISFAIALISASVASYWILSKRALSNDEFAEQTQLISKMNKPANELQKIGRQQGNPLSSETMDPAAPLVFPSAGAASAQAAVTPVISASVPVPPQSPPKNQTLHPQPSSRSHPTPSPRSDRSIF